MKKMNTWNKWRRTLQARRLGCIKRTLLFSLPCLMGGQHWVAQAQTTTNLGFMHVCDFRNGTSTVNGRGQAVAGRRDPQGGNSPYAVNDGACAGWLNGAAFVLANYGYASKSQDEPTAVHVAGYRDGRLELLGRKGVSLIGPTDFSANANFNNHKITNLANGQADQDAVNVSQLKGVLAGLGGGMAINPDGSIQTPIYTVGDNIFNDVGRALANLDGRVTQNTNRIDKCENGGGNCNQGAGSGNRGDGSGNIGPGSGNIGPGSGNIGTDSGNIGLDSGNIGPGSGNIGQGIHNGANGSMSVGIGASATGVNATAEGQGAIASGKNSKANGQGAKATGDNSTAIGQGSTASDLGATALGQGSKATGVNATAEGQGAIASGKNSKANGQGAKATGDNSTAIGQNSDASALNSSAFGQGAQAAKADSVALGQGSIADRPNTVSVGSKGHERIISNVAPGVEGTDAVNVNQLNALTKDTNNRLLDLDKNARRGIAAVSAIPDGVPYLPGRTGVFVGGSTYRGHQAIGLRLSGWSGKGNLNWGIGAGYAGGPNTVVKAQIGVLFGQ